MVLELVVMLFFMLPSVIYVLSQNVPTKGVWIYSLFGNALVVVGIKTLMATLLLPTLARWVAEKGHGSRAQQSHHQQTKMQLVVLLGVLFADVVATVIFDESW